MSDHTAEIMRHKDRIESIEKRLRVAADALGDIDRLAEELGNQWAKQHAALALRKLEGMR